MHTDDADLNADQQIVGELIDAFSEAVDAGPPLAEARRILAQFLTGNASIDRKLRARAEVVYGLKVLRGLLRRGQIELWPTPGLN
jgi:hypothetical protein